MDIKELDLKTFYKMFIIYNAVIDGWKVKKVNNTDNNKIQFEFKKKKKNISENYNEEQFTEYFITKFLGKNIGNYEQILKKNIESKS